MLKRIALLFAVHLVATACAPSVSQGAKDEPCYPNATCNAGLSCEAGICVEQPSEGEGEGEDTPLAGVLANVTPLAAVDECPAGGVDVSTGIDRNANGTLEVDEVTRVVTICNGSDGANAIAETASFDTSDGCPVGGIRLRSGVDRNGDDTLADDELLRSDEVCNGSAGTNGLTTRIVLTTLDPGAPCAAGGTRIESGIDLDGNGVLQPAEVQQQATVCNGEQGPAGTSCSVERNDPAGTTTITCEDGTEAVVHDGAEGAAGDQGAPGDQGLPGSNGADGLQSLVRLEPEFGGPRCPFSGTRILVGIDDNRDGALDGIAAGDGEVDQVSVVCSSEPGPCAANFGRHPSGRCVPLSELPLFLSINRQTSELIAIHQDFTVEVISQISAPSSEVPFSYPCMDRDEQGQLAVIFDLERRAIYNINEITGATSLRVSTNAIVGPGLTFLEGQTYSLAERGAGTPGTLVRVDSSGTVTSLRAMTTPSILGMEGVPGRGLILGDEGINQIFVLSPSNGQSLESGTQFSDQFPMLDFDFRSDGTLWTITENYGFGSSLAQINLTTLQLEVIYTFPANLFLAGLASF